MQQWLHFFRIACMFVLEECEAIDSKCLLNSNSRVEFIRQNAAVKACSYAWMDNKRTICRHQRSCPLFLIMRGWVRAALFAIRRWLRNQLPPSIVVHIQPHRCCSAIYHCCVGARAELIGGRENTQRRIEMVRFLLIGVEWNILCLLKFITSFLSQIRKQMFIYFESQGE